MGILRLLGIAIIVAWLVLWLVLKITVGAIHLLVVIGLAMIIAGFFRPSPRS